MKTCDFHKSDNLAAACGKVTGDKTKGEKLYCSSNDPTSDFCEMRLSPDFFEFTSPRNAQRLLFFYRPYTFPKALHIEREIRCSKNTSKVQSYVAIGGRQVKVSTINTCSCNWDEFRHPWLCDFLMFDFVDVAVFKSNGWT